MGVQFTKLIQGQKIELKDLENKKIAVDTFNWLYQFLSIIRQPDGSPLQDSQGRVTSHLSGLFYRSLKLMEAGIQLAYVFDGEPPKIKAVGEKRRNTREEAKKEWEKALEEEDYEKAKKYAMRSTTLNKEIIESAKRLIEAMGLPCIQAPSEGEAMCSYICAKKDAYAVATQDYDSLLFGAPRIVRNLSLSQKTSEPEMVLLDESLKKLELNREQLISLAILIGTDYNPSGVRGLGPMKALQRVKDKKTTKKIFEDVVWDFEVQPDEIIDFFKNPPVCEYKLGWKEPDAKKIKQIMCDQHEFSEERIDSALAKLRENKPKNSSLGKWS